MRYAASRLIARKPLVASVTLVPETVRTMREPQRCISALGPGEVGDLVGLAVADHDVGAPLEDGRDQSRNVRAGILVVGVRVDDDIRPQPERSVDPGHERRGESAVLRKANDVVHPELGRLRARAVRAAVVDHQHLDRGDARHVARQVGEGRGEVLSLVQAWDLDDQLHAPPGDSGPRTLPRQTDGSSPSRPATSEKWAPLCQRRGTLIPWTGRPA